eukprot:TRINITY_DN1760_c0_g1_i8.p1 TRINITY_DN1760_c0_g1~~TRINITY_DN1760_c0_g1_i8.p1  ORF type:complete len:200 (+),score=65.07 TRINITY_DN1760_c0_g1_i8:363-962(+)
MSLEQMTTFFEQALAATVKKDPIIESGNKYAVSEEFHRMNGKLLMAQATADPRFLALREQDQVRLRGFFDIIFTSKHLRCRNPLHPAVVDTCVLGNLMNFPKHIFGFPFASYGTNGAESLSLVLYSYRQLAGEGDVVWLVSDSEPDTVLLKCCSPCCGLCLVAAAAAASLLSTLGCALVPLVTCAAAVLSCAAALRGSE